MHLYHPARNRADKTTVAMRAVHTSTSAHETPNEESRVGREPRGVDSCRMRGRVIVFDS